MVARITKLVFALGVVVCARSRVSPFRIEEASEIGEALAELAFIYGIRLDRQLEAWVDAGGAVAGAALPRLLEYKPAPPERREELTPETRSPEPPPSPAPPEPAVDPQTVRDAQSFTSA